MAKYIKNYLTVSAATEATDILSPNVTYIQDREKLLMKDVGDDKELEIVLDGSGELKIQEKPKYDYLTFTCVEEGGISLATGKKTQNIQYSKNGGGWINWDYSNISLVTGDVVKMKGINPNGISQEPYECAFFMTGKIAASGNLMSLIDGEKDGTKVIPGNGNCFFGLFFQCPIISAPELPATTLTEYCYREMFWGCSSLTTAPELPATTLAKGCYGSMFCGCTSLTTAPELPATTLANYCYGSMFSLCTSLTTAPELPATTLAEGCYGGMFSSCRCLSTAPELPATTLAESCYGDMFDNCSSLTTAPELPVTTLADFCYSSMFQACTSLTTAPTLPATTLAYACYCNMFYDCTNLTIAPEISATTLAERCYEQMFDGCNNLLVAPKITCVKQATDELDGIYRSLIESLSGSVEDYRNINITFANSSTLWSDLFANNEVIKYPPILSATELTTSCYYNMFNGCTNLIVAPELPATTLAERCYCNMFWGCSSLTTAPELPAATLSSECYYGMFNGCTNLNYIKCLATDISADGCTTEWVAGVSSTGEFVRDANNSDWEDGANGIPEGWTVTPPMRDYLTFTCIEEGGISMGIYGYEDYEIHNPNIQYSKNGGIWVEWDFTNIDMIPGDVVKMKGINPHGFALCEDEDFSVDVYVEFNMIGKIAASGNIMSLIDGKRDGTKIIPSGSFETEWGFEMYCFGMADMFVGCTSLTAAPELPATTLANYCYFEMFYGCRNLSTAPELPATTLASYCYSYMFYWCFNLNYIKCLATDLSAEGCTERWLYRASSTGEFVKDANTTWERGVDGIPEGWTVTVPPQPSQDFKMVDLGLPSGNLWATCNIGASNEIEYGKYFAWGDAEGFEANKVSGKFNETWYATRPGASLSGNIADNDVVHNAAYAAYGSGYTTPNVSDFNELINKTFKEKVSNFCGSGISGWKFWNKNDGSKYIFIPYADAACEGSIVHHENAFIWSTVIDDNNMSKRLFASDTYPYPEMDKLGVDSFYRYCGQSIRAIKRPE